MGSGNKIAFARSPSIYTVNSDGSGLIQLTSGASAERQPDWSPDGKWFAFIATVSGLRQIFLMNGDGSNIAQWTYEPDNCYHPTWSPDGRYIAYIYQGHVRIRSIDGISVRDISMDGGIPMAEPDWSP
jgi:Tol biopolymer transport system component